MKAKLIIFALILIIGFTGCTSSYYVTGKTSPGRHHGYKRGDNYDNRYSDFHRGSWYHRDAYSDWRYRRW